LGRSRTTDWTIAGSHLAERCQQFLIIALGESVLVTGATFCDLSWSAIRVAAFVVAFVGTVALWWIYFYRSAQGGSEVIASAADPGRLGRSAYTYFHLPMVAGIIVTAVADELTIARPDAHSDPATTAVILGDGALFLAGHALFKWALSGRLYASRLVAIVALGALVPVGMVASPLPLAAAATLVLVIVACWDTRIIWSSERQKPESESETVPSVAH
jgi:low temperature requirement protein LtrA